MLKISNLHTRIENKEILKGISISIKEGEIHAIMGPNGSGKSTLAYTLMGHPHYQVTSGSALLNGKEILDLSPDERSKLGLFLAFQYPTAVSGISVQNFLRNVSQAHHKSSESVLEFRKTLIKKAKNLGVTEELLKRSLNDGFSGGEKKRVEMLQMATLKPQYAILDETDSGLDIDAIKAVAMGVKLMKKEFKTGIILITHYQRILKYLKPNYVHILVGGRIVESGSVKLAQKLEKEGYKSLNNKYLI